MSRLLLVTLTLAGLVLLALMRAGAEGPGNTQPASPETKKTANGENEMVYARVIDLDGNLTAPVLTSRLVLSDEEWKKRLTPEQFAIARHAGTERPFCGGLLKNKEAGLYLCVGCGLPIFDSGAKFESGTGWPSFYQPVGATNILERTDASHGMVRTEIVCPRCESHFGHLFDDGPEPTGLRYCLNSESLRFVARDQLKAAGEKVENSDIRTVVLAGGCFWCVEGVFREIDGVLDATSGYAGGDAKSANYKAVCSGTTGHAEAVRLAYDPHRVSFEDLLRVHFATHDPTTLNRQGADTGTQYRSAIFYANDQEKAAAKAFLDELTTAKAFPGSIVTTLEPLKEFYPAEAYHQNYVCRNPNQGYVRAVSMPKVKKARELFGKGKLTEKAAKE